MPKYNRPKDINTAVNMAVNDKGAPRMEMNSRKTKSTVIKKSEHVRNINVTIEGHLKDQVESGDYLENIGTEN